MTYLQCSHSTVCGQGEEKSNWWKLNISMVDVDVCSPAVLFCCCCCCLLCIFVLLSFRCFDFAVHVFVSVFDRLPALCQNKQQQSNWWKHNISMVDVDVCSPTVLFGYFAVHIVLLSFHFDFAVHVFVSMFLIDSPHIVQRSSSSVARTFWVTFHR